GPWTPSSGTRPRGSPVWCDYAATSGSITAARSWPVNCLPVSRNWRRGSSATSLPDERLRRWDGPEPPDTEDPGSAARRADQGASLRPYRDRRRALAAGPARAGGGVDPAALRALRGRRRGASSLDRGGA